MQQRNPRPAFAADYVPVNERLAAFMEKYPDGSLQSEIVELSDTRVVIRAYAYRTPDDPRPGQGHSSLEIPGRTPYTRGSEIENAETSAWGRALAALGFETKHGIASAEEVENKRGEPPQLRPRPVQTAQEPSSADIAALHRQFGSEPFTAEEINEAVTPAGSLTSAELYRLAEENDIPKARLSVAAKTLFGVERWKITDLTDEERGQLWESLA